LGARFNETELTATLPNGSVIYVLGVVSPRAMVAAPCYLVRTIGLEPITFGSGAARYAMSRDPSAIGPLARRNQA
jgi:hypothetical protein